MVEREPNGTQRDREPVVPGSGGEGEAWAVLSFLLTGFLLYGGIGWALDRWLGTQVFTPIGILGGGAAAIYLVYVRYVVPDRTDPRGARRPEDQEEHG